MCAPLDLFFTSRFTAKEQIMRGWHSCCGNATQTAFPSHHCLAFTWCSPYKQQQQLPDTTWFIHITKPVLHGIQWLRSDSRWESYCYWICVNINNNVGLQVVVHPTMKHLLTRIESCKNILLYKKITFFSVDFRNNIILVFDQLYLKFCLSNLFIAYSCYFSFQKQFPAIIWFALH